MAKILVIEDEVKIARFVQLELMHEGYDVEVANDGLKGFECILKKDADLVVLDVMLPGLNGLEVCKRTRESGIDIPIIMLTAKDDVMDKVSGLDKGADDYMTKPFAIEELLARIRVAIARHEKFVKGEGMHKEQKEIIEYGKLKLNASMRIVTYDGDEIELTKKEFDLLEYLLKNINIAVSRDTILNEVWEYEFFGNTNVVDVYVRYIRQKIDDKYGVKIIRTVRGVGYIIRSIEEMEN